MQTNESAVINVESVLICVPMRSATPLCPLCQEDLLVKSNVRLTDGHRVCLNCLNQHLATGITEGRVELRCPIYDCPKSISFDLVDRLLTEYQPHLRPKWKSIERRKALLPEADVIWCPRPFCPYMTRPAESGNHSKIDCQYSGELYTIILSKLSSKAIRFQTAKLKSVSNAEENGTGEDVLQH